MRLLPGENAKIDNINELVRQAQSNIEPDVSYALEELLKLFHPMILKTCKKWSEYFRDYTHKIKPFDILVNEAQSWFYDYTVNKYIIDGSATYNKFIKDHIDQRVRYIYECELKYMSHHIFPDPDKCMDDNHNDDAFERVVYDYTSDHGLSIEDALIQKDYTEKRCAVSNTILLIVNDDRYFNAREKQIFECCIYGDVTHEQMSKNLGISRTRVSQVVNKIRIKIRQLILSNEDVDAWEVIENITKFMT
jgi:hypothetical protein